MLTLEHSHPGVALELLGYARVAQSGVFGFEVFLSVEIEISYTSFDFLDATTYVFSMCSSKSLKKHAETGQKRAFMIFLQIFDL